MARDDLHPGLFAINDTDLINVLPNRINEDCDPQPGVTNYWRVRPLDRPFERPGGGGSPACRVTGPRLYRFKYTGLSMSNLAPANGAVCRHPGAQPGRDPWRADLHRDGQGTVLVSRSTPRRPTAPRTPRRASSGSPRRTTPTRGRCTPRRPRAPSPWPRSAQFSVTGNQPSTGAPALTPLTPATSAVLQRSAGPHLGAAPGRRELPRPRDPTPTGVLITKGIFEATAMPYASFTDTSGELKRAGTYTWWVTAHALSGAQGGRPVPRAPSRSGHRAPDGHKVALGGRASDPTSPGRRPCVAGPPPATGVCTVPATPVLRWAREPGIRLLHGLRQRRPEFSTLLEPDTATPATTNTMYTPALDNQDWTYGDNQTEQPVLLVRGDPVVQWGSAAPGPVGIPGSAQHSFFKKSPPVDGAARAR